MFTKFDKNGKCPYGYEYVNGYRQEDIWIDGYCRKLPKKRFTDPDKKQQKLKEQKIQESREMAEKEYGESRERDTKDGFSEEHL